MSNETKTQELDADILAIRELLSDEAPAPLQRAPKEKAQDVPPPQAAIVQPPAPDPVPEAVTMDVSETVQRAVAPQGKPAEDDAALAEGIREAVSMQAEHDDALTAKIRQAKAAAATTQAGKAPSRVSLLLGQAIARIKGYRPTRRHITLAVLVVLALLRPWLLLVLLLLPIVIVTGIFVSLGHDRFWAGVLRLYTRYQARNPKRAERLRQRADAFALRWDSVLDRFPEGWVDGLYLPDLNSMQEKEAEHEKALDERFSKLHDEAKAR